MRCSGCRRCRRVGIVDTVVTSGRRRSETEFGRGGGAIIALPHMANWDLAGAWACLTGMPVSTVAERLRPESLYDRFVRYREGLGMEVIALTGAGNPLARLRASLAAGRLVCLLADRDLGRRGCRGQPAGRAGPAPGRTSSLARMTGAPLFRAHPDLPRTADAPRVRPPDRAAAGARRAGRDDAGHGRLVLPRHPQRTAGLAHDAAGVHVRPAEPDRGRGMRIGLVCPYSLDVPGGVQSHVRDLARGLLARGHEVRLLRAGQRRAGLAGVCADDRAGGAGAVQRIRRPTGVRTACAAAHASMAARRRLRRPPCARANNPEPRPPRRVGERSPCCRHLSHRSAPIDADSVAGASAAPVVDRLAAQVAVSDAARRSMASQRGSEPGSFPTASTTRRSRPRSRDGGGRARPDHRVPRPLGRATQGIAVAARRLGPHSRSVPVARLLVGGPWPHQTSQCRSQLRQVVEFLGELSDRDRASLLASADAFVAPNSGERASESSWSRRWPRERRSSRAICPRSPPSSTAAGPGGCSRRETRLRPPRRSSRCSTPPRERRAACHGQAAAKAYDWSRVVPAIETVYEAALGADPDSDVGFGARDRPGRRMRASPHPFQTRLRW